MKYYPFAAIAKQASSPTARDRFAAMAHGNRLCTKKAPTVLAGIEGWLSKSATK